MTTKQRARIGFGLALLIAVGVMLLPYGKIGGQSTPIPLLFQLLRHPNPSVPSVVATVNGQPLSSAEYQGQLAIAQACVQETVCGAAQRDRTLGPANVALTYAVDHLLLEQYGTAHGITVSDAEVQTALGQQAVTLQQMLAQGGGVAAEARENLSGSSLSDPSQIPNDPGWQALMTHIILRGNTLSAFAPIGGGANGHQKEDDLLSSLQQQAKVTVNVGAQLLDPHQLELQPAAPPLTPGAFPSPTGPRPPVATTPPAGMASGPIRSLPHFDPLRAGARTTVPRNVNSASGSSASIGIPLRGAFGTVARRLKSRADPPQADQVGPAHGMTS